MGRKRRENYDDWWRCEIQFKPVLDELFGVTHTKQFIRPDATLVDILQPHIEGVAHTLNARVRQKFQTLRENHSSRAGKAATERDYLLEPPKEAIHTQKDHDIGRASTAMTTRRIHARLKVGGLKYQIKVSDECDDNLFIPGMNKNILTLTLNSGHPFFKSALKSPGNSPAIDAQSRFYIELLLLSASRAELMAVGDTEKCILCEHRINWSNNLASFLS